MGQYVRESEFVIPGVAPASRVLVFGVAETVFAAKLEEFEKSAKPGRPHQHAKRALRGRKISRWIAE
jgi:hypothetical protein